jgi:hypothetical protein
MMGDDRLRPPNSLLYSGITEIISLIANSCAVMMGDFCQH